jgi:hypothetical protein
VPKRIVFEDTGERREPKDGEWYCFLVENPFKPEHYAILRQVGNDFTMDTGGRPPRFPRRPDREGGH